jgi:hypothetical protein
MDVGEFARIYLGGALSQAPDEIQETKNTIGSGNRHSEQKNPPCE